MKNVTVTYTTTIDSPQGAIILAATDRGLCGLYFEGQKHMPDRNAWIEDRSRFEEIIKQLQDYFQGKRRRFKVRVFPTYGTIFQRQVWIALQSIESGTTTTYGEIARQVGKPEAVRAVGAAIGRNPLSIIIPCHRVVGSKGTLTGYAGGVERKEWLLKHEGAR